MEISEKVLKSLRQFGLTEYEIKVYVALVNAGASTAGDVSKIAGVPYSRIYDVLSKLEHRGWLEVHSGRPIRYRAKPPGDAIRIAQERLERSLTQAGESVLQELNPIFEKQAETKRPDVWIIHGARNVLTKIEEMLRRAQNEVLVVVPSLTEPEAIRLQPFLQVFQTKEIKVRMIFAEKNPKIKLFMQPFPKLKVRYKETLFGGGVIVDSREILLLLASLQEKLGIWSDEPGLATFAKEYFEYLWKDSTELMF
ncbi:MAG: TrmB family transcriptional regulator [Euryarchaeota archaeon]|nr:TrmB family transcriptional regulator [Euryarchaeota archaeon]